MAPPRTSSGSRSSSGRPPARSGGGSRGGFGGDDRGPSAGRGGKPMRGGAGPMDKPKAFYGVLEIDKKGIFVKPTSRNQKFVVELTRKNLNGAEDGEMVFVGRLEEKPQPHKPARLGDYAVRERLGSSKDVRNYSLLSLLEAGLQPNFPPKVIDSCYEFAVPELGNREDLRDLPLVTIDGEDARDFDDAVYARPADDGKGWYAIIAIADVAHYVREGTPLDKEALRRGNSTYFPDRVVPMLPERLSNDLCSLRPNEDRACMHVHVWIDEEGAISDWKIGRGLMRSAARLTYNQVQKALDGQPDGDTQPLLEQIQYLYKIFCVLLGAREKRGALDINAPERKIMLDGEGGVAAVVPRERLEAHQLIEELMITANVVVATALESKDAPCMYRVHDRPSAFKVAMLAEYVKPLGLKLPTQQAEIEQQMFNSVLEKVQEVPDLAPVINDLVLRCQMQAIYTPENIGHFGLALERYAHFTSPIRRYADLINHRALITAFGLGDDGLKEEDKNLMEEWAEQISQTERASMLAERACVDRFTAHFLQTQLGKEITGRISSVTSFGLFISLLDGVGEALVPMRLLPHDFYDFIEEQQLLLGQRSGRVYRLGGRVSLMITGIDPVLGSITAQLLGEESADLAGFEKPRGNDDRRPPRRDDRDQREERRPPYKGGRDSKPPFKSRDGDDRGPRKTGFGGKKPFRKPDGDDRPRYKAYGDDDRPARRERSGEERAERPQRPYKSRDDRGGDDRGERRPPRRDYGDAPRPPRREYGDAPRPARGPRDDARGERTPRSYGSRDDRGGDDRGERRPPRREYGDSPRPPRREYGDAPRPPRREYDDSRPPRRDYDDSRPPRRDYGDDARPARGGPKGPPRSSSRSGDDRGPARGERSERPASKPGGKPPFKGGPKSGGRSGAPSPRSGAPKKGRKF